MVPAEKQQFEGKKRSCGHVDEEGPRCGAAGYLARTSYRPIPLEAQSEATPTIEIWNLSAAPSGAHPQAQFNHILSGGYAAAYYVYLWSLVYAQDMFTAFQRGAAWRVPR